MKALSLEDRDRVKKLTKVNNKIALSQLSVIRGMSMLTSLSFSHLLLL